MNLKFINVEKNKLKMKSIVKRLYLSETDSLTKRGKPLGRWEDRVGDWMCERGTGRGGGLEWGGEVWGLFCHAYHLLESKASETLDR